MSFSLFNKISAIFGKHFGYCNYGVTVNRLGVANISIVAAMKYDLEQNLGEFWQHIVNGVFGTCVAVRFAIDNNWIDADIDKIIQLCLFKTIMITSLIDPKINIADRQTRVCAYFAHRNLICFNNDISVNGTPPEFTKIVSNVPRLVVQIPKVIITALTSGKPVTDFTAILLW